MVYNDAATRLASDSDRADAVKKLSEEVSDLVSDIERSDQEAVIARGNMGRALSSAEKKRERLRTVRAEMEEHLKSIDQVHGEPR